MQKYAAVLITELLGDVTLSVNLKMKLKLVSAQPHRGPSVPWSRWRHTCPSEGVLNLVATGSETAGLIRRRRGRPPIGCGLCSCQSARTLPPPAFDQSVILRAAAEALTAGAGPRDGEAGPSEDPDGSVGRPLLLLPIGAVENKDASPRRIASTFLCNIGCPFSFRRISIPITGRERLGVWLGSRTGLWIGIGLGMKFGEMKRNPTFCATDFDAGVDAAD